MISRPNTQPLTRFENTQALIEALQPTEPVYCLYPDRLRAIARRFVDGFPGRTMFAVKANPFPAVIDTLWDAGIRCFDTASLPEVQLVHERHPDADLFFMAPVRFRGAAEAAYESHGVRRFVVDHPTELDRIMAASSADDTTIFVRVAAENPDAIYEFASKFGATPDETVAMLEKVAAAGFEPGLAFNTGSMVMDPSAYEHGLSICRGILERVDHPIRHLDIGGGFPWVYPDIPAPAVEAYFERVAKVRETLPLADDATIYCEPGRALCADGMSLIVQVLMRKDDRVYLNDGVYGSLSENNLSHGEVWYPTRIMRAGGGGPTGAPMPFTIFGPTCDSLDKLPTPIPLPADIAEGDWIEIGTMGAYSNSTRTAFNGIFPDTLVEITAGEPPQLAD